MNIPTINIPQVLELEKAFWTIMSEKHSSFEGLEAFITKVFDPMLNPVFCTPSVDINSFRTNILSVSELLQKYQLPWTLWCNPYANVPASLLEEYNFSLIEQIPSLYFDISKNKPDYKSVLKIENVVIREALTSGDINDWFEPVAESFKIPQDNTDLLQLMLKKPYGLDQPFHHYIAYLNDIPIAAVTILIHKSFAMLRNIARKNAYPHKGLASAITLYALEQAEEYSCQTVFLETSKGEVNHYRKLGFQELFINDVYVQTLL